MAWVAPRDIAEVAVTRLLGAGMTPGLTDAVLGMSTGLRDGFVPEQPRTVHTTTPTSDEPASMLILFAPGAPRERYFEGLVERRTMDVQPTDEELAELYRRHDTYWVGDRAQ